VWLSPTHPTAGASGAIFGLMGALVVYGFRRGGTLGQALRRQMITWGLIGIALGFVMPVNNVAHIVGGTSGALIAALLGLRERDRAGEGILVRVLATVLLVMFTASWGLAAIEGARYRTVEDFERKHHLGEHVPQALRVSLRITGQMVQSRGAISGGDVARYEWVEALEETATTLQAWQERHAAPGLTIERATVAKDLGQLAKQLRDRESAQVLENSAAALLTVLDQLLTYVSDHPASQWS
jgi:hypothetical protein